MRHRQCGTCGGLIKDLSKVSFRLADPTVTVAAARAKICLCPTPIVYGPPAGFMSIPSMPSYKRPMVESGANANRGRKPSG
jgi:hypothetical protein